MNQLNSILLASVLAVALMNQAAAADVSLPEPAVGPARESGLQCLGQLRVRRSEEIGGSRWGVSCCWIADEHPLSVEQRLEHLNAVGAKWALLVPDWDHIEQQKGKYDWNTPAHRLDDAVNGLVRRKIAPVVQIYGGNQLYMQTGPDANNRPLADAAKLLDGPEARPAWHRFVEALVRRYRAQVKVWEIWNEPNGEWFWATPTTVEQYGRMVKDVAAIIKRAQPGAVILAGSTANVPLDYLEKFLASESAKCFDRWSVHPYGELPEAAEPRILGARELLRKHGKSPAVWQSECGFPSSADTGGWGFGGRWDETKHAKWLLRRLLSDARLGMPVSIYFVLHDYPAQLEAGPDKGKMGINRKGLYWHGSWERKPAADAFAHLSSLLNDRFEFAPAAPPPSFEITANGSLAEPKTETIKTCLLKHKPSGQPALVYWLGVPMETKFRPARVTVTMPGAAIKQPVLVDLLDGNVYALPRGTRFENLPLADSPLVLCDRSAVEIKP
ncbi:MAG: hypothetical protein NTY01_18780 [Verrucomicrobia bacterium]|nr:hypothetical protein [Verrucomicrobiota bacterium]